VRLVVDANIVVSTLLKSDGAVADVLLRSGTDVEFYAPEFIRVETSLHREKFARLTGASIEVVAEVEEVLLSGLTVVQAASIDTTFWERAGHLVGDIDPKDDHYVALALHLKCPLWTGDKKLLKGLPAKGFKQVLSTEQVRSLLRRK
jgi:predicted nucleic acid-binding protein